MSVVVHCRRGGAEYEASRAEILGGVWRLCPRCRAPAPAPTPPAAPPPEAA